jgi:hypothetical protein
MKKEKKRMHYYIGFFGGHPYLGITTEVRDVCLSLIRYAKRIKRTGQALRKDYFFKN